MKDKSFKQEVLSANKFAPQNSGKEWLIIMAKTTQTTTTNERSQTIIVGGVEYELLLTTAATKQIGKKYGGLQKLGEEIVKPENFEDGIDIVSDIICLLANQSVRRHNALHPHPQDKKEELTTEKLELLTEPWELQTFNNAIVAAIAKGTARNVRSADQSDGNSKNEMGG